MREFDNLKIRKLDAGLLLVFRELMVRRRASDVAEHLGLSPSAISHALGRLRDLFGDPLFIRRSHGLTPTQKARDLEPAVERLLELIDDVVSPERGFDPASSRRLFRIACPDWIGTLIAPSLVEAFHRDAPGLTFSTRYGVHDNALRAVQRGEADVALGAFDRIPAGFSVERLFEDQYCIVARQGHPLVDGAVDLVAYATAGHLYCGNPDGALGDDVPIDRPAMDATYGRLPAPSLIRTEGYVPQWETAMLAVSRTDSLAECPRRLAERYADRLGLQVLAPPYRPFRLQVLAIRRENVADAGADWLIDQIRAAVAA
jgi:DNA-binding transcriptional LysR family regulator